MTARACGRPLAPALWRALALLLLGLLLSLQLPGLAAAQGTAPAAGAQGFDHLRTGFALTGRHAQQRCEACHQNGVLQGTPRDCVSCHQSGQRFARGNVVMSANHLPTQQSCDTCHDTRAFTPARFNHGNVAAGSCASCHNGARAGGKPANHLPQQALAATASAACDSCHKGGFSSWANGRLHANVSVSSGCASCHNGQVMGAAGKPATPVHATATTCESCHGTGSWAAARVDHASFTSATACTSCHNGSTATGKSATHVPVGNANCSSCHASSGWKPTTWNHTQLPVANQCAGCHSGAYPPADGRSANHVPYAGLAALNGASCDTCHKAGFAAWAPAKVHRNVALTSGCASCHTGAFAQAVGKPNNAVHASVGGNCESCHKSTSAWAGAKVDHGAFNDSTACSSCHNGSAATGKSATHVPVGTTNCAACHATAGWTPTKWTHAQVAVNGQCASCHSGGFPPADGKPGNHLAEGSFALTASSSCDACHKGSFSSWADGRLHANFTFGAQCDSCHNGNTLGATAKPANALHANVSGSCESCHKSTSSWAGTKVNHANFNDSTNCASCHNGSAATGKPAGHVPVGSAGCIGCHSTSGWTPTKWNHTQLAVAAQCASCHTGSYPPADGKPANHIPYQGVALTSSANCDSCHKGSYSSWANGKLHANFAITGACASCHTGAFLNAAGKPGTTIHATVTGNCESCHKSTTNWSAKVDHSTFNDSTNCASCHNGSAATGKSATHTPVGATNCISCHSTAGWTPTKWNHTQLPVTSQCASCHSGGYPPADGKPVNHIPYQNVAVTASANCDSCHKGSYSSWGTGKLHSNFTITSGCVACHSGSYLSAVGKPATTIHATVTGNCESCHKSTSTWSGAKVDHGGFNDTTNCASCHNGSAATGKSATHIPVGSTNCFTCHNTTGWTPTKWNHTQLAVTAQCASCHTGGYPPADGKPANHIPYQGVAVSSAANCDACHKGSFSSWATGKFHGNFTVSAGCASCHTGAYLNAVGKPATTIHATVTGNCESCHKSTSTWSGAKVDHGGFNDSTNCASCHNGSGATGKPASHIPVGSTNCFTCHNTTGWTPTKWNHTQLPVTSQCASCHSGGYPPADGKPANHIPYQGVAVTSVANCDSCHKGSYSSWANGKLHSNFSISSNCVACHTGTYLNAVGKPNTAIHATVTGNCESCHKSTSTWSGAKVDHSTFNDTTNCANCHNGSTATGKSATHIPSGSTNCFTCHNTTGWTPTKWNHTQLPVTSQCASCHTGGYPPADGKPANHIPYQSVAVTSAANCDSCHKGSYTSWVNGKLHNNFSISSNCVACHTGAYLNAVGKPNTAIHASVTGNCESCHKSTTSWTAKVDHSGFNDTTNCASCHNGSTATGKPATHIPVGSTNCYTCHGTTGWTPTKWNHTQLAVTAQCASCHTGGYPPADGKPANHIPYQSVPVSTAANCDACHKGSYTSWANGKFHSNFSVSTTCATCHTGTYLNAVGKPNTAIHATVTGNCESCHKSTTSWSAKVDHSTFNDTTNCANCHNGSTATGKPATHIPVGATNCYSCHNTTGWTPTKWNHTQLAVTAQCASCHSGGYPPADGKPGNHIPYQSVAVTSAANCDSCHKGSYTSWANGKLHSNFSISSNCVACHTGTYLNAVGKPNTAIHATVTGNCESCHKSTTSWTAKVDHSGFNDTTNCASCHNGSTATGKPATHIPVGSTNCYSCHGTTGWTPTKWNHTQLVVTAQCASCHTGGYPPADGKPTNHIPYQSVPVSTAANCDSCHKGSYTSWANGKFHSNYSVSTSCATCHTGTYLNAVGKPNTAIHATVTGNCESCHKSTTSWSAKVDHSTFNDTTNCASCHNGSTATGKPATHIPVGSTNCYSCHSTTGWTPTKWNHTQLVVTAQCASCHSGGYPPADGKPANHIPYQSVPVSTAANCDACHKGSYTSWANGKFHANFSVSTTCATCHTGSYLNAVGKPGNATHASVTGNCESCHKSTSSWSQVNYTHSAANAVGTGTCDTCHNGSNATGKPASHIPIPAGAARCDSCHKSQSAWNASVTMNHSVVTAGACKSCHNGSYLSAGTQGALAKPSNHIPEVQLLNGAAMDCNACHTSTSSWGSQKMNHNASQGNGAGWCKACHQSGTSYLGSMEHKSLTHQKSSGVTDCSQSGCHRPLGNKGSPYTKWD
ncbi:hypothetical protein [Aquabacterium sp.]|uniref:hypothetical protein n=1 Tax=Aquabacterium sp. TaxID=1872578 RepID=UPI003783A27D